MTGPRPRGLPGMPLARLCRAPHTDATPPCPTPRRNTPLPHIPTHQAPALSGAAPRFATLTDQAPTLRVDLHAYVLRARDNSGISPAIAAAEGLRKLYASDARRPTTCIGCRGARRSGHFANQCSGEASAPERQGLRLPRPRPDRPLPHNPAQRVSAPHPGAIGLCSTSRGNGPLLHILGQWASASKCGARHRSAQGHPCRAIRVVSRGRRRAAGCPAREQVTARRPRRGGRGRRLRATGGGPGSAKS